MAEAVRMAVRYLRQFKNLSKTAHVGASYSVAARFTAPEKVRAVHWLKAVQSLNDELRQRAQNGNPSLLRVEEQPRAGDTIARQPDGITDAETAITQEQDQSTQSLFVPVVAVAGRQDRHHFFLCEWHRGALLHSGALHLGGRVLLNPFAVNCEAEERAQPLQFLHDCVSLVSPGLTKPPHQFEIFPLLDVPQSLRSSKRLHLLHELAVQIGRAH